MRKVRHPQKKRKVHPRIEKMNRRRAYWKQCLIDERQHRRLWNYVPRFELQGVEINMAMLDWRDVRKFLAEDELMGRWYGYIIKRSAKESWPRSKDRRSCKRDGAKKERQYYRDSIRHYMNGRIEDIDHIPVSRLVTLWDYW